MRSGGQPSMRRPSKRISPLVGLSTPESRLKRVVLPLPLGPMRPTNSPASSAKSTPATAVAPPKSFCSPFTSSRATAGKHLHGRGLHRPLGHQPLRPKHNEHHQQRPDDDVAQVVDVKGRLDAKQRSER